MSSSSSSNAQNNAMRLMMAQAMAEVVKMLAPQLGSSDEFFASDPAKLDYWVLSDFEPEIIIPMAYMDWLAENEGIAAAKVLGDKMRRGFNSKSGTARKQLAEISMAGLGGGGNRKIMKKPGWTQRNITNRGWKEKADEENVEIVE